jgi:aryl-alcohol dehydrogenase-like predicted oxidoreductase
MFPTRPARYSRRQALELGLLAGAAAIARPLLAADTQPPLITKPIPSSGERLPVIGLGAIWYRDAQYQQLRAVLQRMTELGGTLVDTAAAYGESEGVIGRALAESHSRSSMFIATKFDAGGTGPGFGPGPGPAPTSAPPSSGAGLLSSLPGPPTGIQRPTPDGIGGRESFERSLSRLQTRQIDLLQVHGLNGTDALMPLMQDWKRAKKIRYIGVTTSNPQQHAELMAAMRRYPLDFIQVDYSIENREAADAVLPLAVERKVAVLVNLPLGRARLIEKAGARPLPSWAAELGIASWSQFLLKYVVSHPAVTCAIPGATQVKHLEDNQGAGRGRLPDAAERRRMEQFWAAIA